MTNVREIAYDALLIIDKGQQSNSLLKDILDKYSYLDKKDRSFLARLVEGTTERMLTIDYVMGQFSKVPVKKMKPPVRTLLRMGVYQIMYMDQVPESAAVNETVKLAKKRGLSSLSGFINGVLRNIARNVDAIVYPSEEKATVKYLSVFYSCPEWITKMLLDNQGFDNAKAVLENSISVRPLTVRVNQSRISTEELVSRLYSDEKSGGNIDGNIIAKASDILPYCIELQNVDRIADIQEFKEGFITVQDLSSMLVGHLSGIKEDDLVIDVCAAPGGKSMHAADLAIKGKVISCDVSQDKLARIDENIKRCDFSNVELKCLDATVRYEEFLEKADVLIADLPCSGLGVMGRKNDIKYRIQPNQLNELAKLQRLIIDNVVNYVKKGGTLMFSTCTVNPLENEENVKYIESKGFRAIDFYDDLPAKLQKDSAHKGYIQLYGEEHLSDGFFIAKFVRV